MTYADLLLLPVALLLVVWLIRRIRRRGLRLLRPGMIVSIEGVERRITKVNRRTSTITVEDLAPTSPEEP